MITEFDQNKIFSKLMIATLICFGLLIIMPLHTPFFSVTAADTWTQTSETDFKKGTMNNVVIFNTDEDSELRLDSTDGWEDMVPSTSPTVRYSHDMATIFGTDQVLLFGGSSNMDDTWIFDSSDNTWTEKSPTTKPMGRQYHAMTAIYDMENVFLFGGINYSSGELGDTWIYDAGNNAWTNKQPSTNPQGRYGHTVAYIDGTNKILLFGGSSWTSGLFKETWIYDINDNSWSEQTVVNEPSGRQNQAMASVDGTDNVVLFGGYDGSFDQETWVYDLSDNTWTKRLPENKPSARAGHAMATIYGTDKVVLNGGLDSEDSFNDTWIYDLSDNTWTKQLPSTKPPARGYHTMASIHNKYKVMLFGGYDYENTLDDTWQYNFAIYTKTGTFISAPFDTGSNSPPYGKLSWNVTLTTYASLKFQLRSASTELEIENKEFLGNDGTESTFYTTSPAKIWSGHNGDRWIQYKAHFSTTNEDDTPRLTDVSIMYNVMPGPPILEEPYNDTWVNSNEPSFYWEYNGTDFNPQNGFQLQLDDDNEFTSIDYDSLEVTTSTCAYVHSEPISDGIWYWRVKTQNHDGVWGPYSGIYILKIDTTIENAEEVTVTPAIWTSENNYSIDWSEPDDLSGIKTGAYYFSNPTPPTDQADGTWTLDKPISITDMKEGENTIYIWLEDEAGNTNYENYTAVTLKLDTCNPTMTHEPVQKGISGEEIIITIEVKDIHSGIKEVFLYYKTPKDAVYTSKPMDENDYIFSTKISSDSVTTRGLEYYIKVLDESMPSNVVYYGKDGLTESEPTTENDIDIKIIKKEADIFDQSLLYGIVGIIIVVIIILIIVLINRKKKQTASASKTGLPPQFGGQTMPTQPVRSPYPSPHQTYPSYPGTYSQPQVPQPSQYQPQYTQHPQYPPSPAYQSPSQQEYYSTRCEKCGASFSNQNYCPSCGWSKIRY